MNDIDNTAAAACNTNSNNTSCVSGKKEEKAKKAAFLAKLLGMRFEDSFCLKMKITAPKDVSCACGCEDESENCECAEAVGNCDCTDTKPNVCFEKSFCGETSCNLVKAAAIIFSAMSACALLCAVCSRIKK